MAPHKHAEFIKAWADGAEVQVLTENAWRTIGCSPSWIESNEYRIKPAEPERSYPKTLMTDKELQNAIPFHMSFFERPRYLANAVLQHACDSGQVVTREEFDKLAAAAKEANALAERAMAQAESMQAQREARDMAVAKEVVSSMCWVLNPVNWNLFDEDYLHPVIARVKP